MKFRKNYEKAVLDPAAETRTFCANCRRLSECCMHGAVLVDDTCSRFRTKTGENSGTLNRRDRR